jgi:RHS repeat-associated protein
VTFDRGTLAFSYSGSTGQLTSLTGPASTSLAFTYDGFLPKTVTWGGPITGSVGVSYDRDFRVTSQTVNGSNPITFGYDADGLLTAAGALGIQRASTTGFVERDSVSGMLGQWTYDLKGALASYTASVSGGDTVFRTSYVRDSLSRIEELTEIIQGDTNVAEFIYDDAGRLETVTRNGQLTASYEYDANGNRLELTTQGGTVTGSYDDQDRLTSYGTATYSYGRNGELAEQVVGTDTTRYTYDALGNLTAVRLPDGTLIEYVIDPQNRRVGKKVDGVLVQGFLWQGQLAPVAELDSTGAVVSRFVYATRVNVPDHIVKDAQTYRLVLDHLGSVRLVVNTSNDSVVQRLDYDEFGVVTLNTNPGFQPFGFAGGLYDEQTGLVRFGARDYDAEVGRWTAKDPMVFDGADPNLYTYTGNRPLDFTDPAGTEPVPAGIREILAPYFPTIDLGRVEVVRFNAFLRVFGDFHGMTVNSLIFAPPDLYSRTMTDQVEFFAHELTHVEQYQRLGLWKFKNQYFGEYRYGRRTLGLDRFWAYYRISLEVEARWYEDLVMKDIKRRMCLVN